MALAAASVVTLSSAKEDSRCAGTVNFTIAMRYIPYKPRVPPDDNNSNRGYSPLLCVVHDHRFRLWRRGSPLPSQLVSVIRNRNYTDALNYLATFRQDNQSVYNWSTSTLIDEDTSQTKVYNGVDSVNISANGTQNATWVACFVALIPSPDWFLGFESINLCEANKTNNSFSFVSPRLENKLPYQYDAGVDNQENVGFQSQPQDPPSPVSVRTEIWKDKVGDYIITNADAPPTPKPTPTPIECFPADAPVRLADGSDVPVQNLQPGDEVDGGSGIPSPVYMVSHADDSTEAQFVRAHFEDNGTLTASAGHYVPTHNGGVAAMDELQRGARLVRDTGDVRVVQRTEIVRAPGLYNPHTLSGNLIVDGTLVTSYTRALAPRTAHGALAVPRALYRCGLGALVANAAHSALGTGLLNVHLARMIPAQWRR